MLMYSLSMSLTLYDYDKDRIPKFKTMNRLNVMLLGGNVDIYFLANKNIIWPTIFISRHTLSIYAQK